MARAPDTEPQAVERVEEAAAGPPPGDFPLVQEFAAELTSGSGEERFSFAIETFLEGLVSRRHRKG